MAKAKDKSVDRKIEKATHSVAAKAGELSDAALQKVVGGKVSDYSFDIERVLNIGSQSSGAGAGKASFKM